jgi:hypothetical protein
MRLEGWPQMVHAAILRGALLRMTSREREYATRAYSFTAPVIADT